MSFIVRKLEPGDAPAWDAYVHSHPRGSLYHLSCWRKVIQNTYGHKTYYLMAYKENSATAINSAQKIVGPEALEKPPLKKTSSVSVRTHVTNNKSVVGILPLVHLKHFFFGNSLISIPFFDFGGVLAQDKTIEKALLSEAIELGRQMKVRCIELRHIHPLSCLNELDSSASPVASVKTGLLSAGWRTQTLSHKVRMLLDLPDSSEILMKSFKSKLRSQIKKPLKEGLHEKRGGLELIDAFYKVFCINMKDLGSPVHSKRLIENVLREFPSKSQIIVIYKNDQPLASSLVIGFKNTLENPWASALRKYSRLSPNMLLYWTMLEYASENGYRYFDFGRSSPDEGTYKFKEQWGAKPDPLYWHYISHGGHSPSLETSDKSRFVSAVNYWKKLPVPISRVLGPRIRKHIGL